MNLKSKILLVIFALLLPQVMWAHSFGPAFFTFWLLILFFVGIFLSMINSVVIAIFWKDLSNKEYWSFTLYKSFSFILSFVSAGVLSSFLLVRSEFIEDSVLDKIIIWVFTTFFYFFFSVVYDYYFYYRLGKRRGETLRNTMAINAKVNSIMTSAILIIMILFIVFTVRPN